VAYVPLTALWLPIVLSAVIVFVASSIIHMVLGYHRSDYKQLPDEERVLPGLRAANLPRGRYHFPFCTHKDMKSPENQEKFKRGPVGFLVIYPPGFPPMGKFLSLWFVFCLLISIFVAYLTGRTLAPGTDYLHVFQIAGTAAFMAYGLSRFSDAIWKGQGWSMTIKEIIDGLIYALLTAGTFGWLWPHH